MKDEQIKNRHLRNNEYYLKQEQCDYLYKQSTLNYIFTKLIGLILDINNLRLAYRNIKKNKGKNAKGVSGKNLTWISQMKLKVYLLFVSMQIRNYKPGLIRRVGIPKANGKIRFLGIKEAIDKIVEQAILQIIEPIAIAKFHNNSNGFIKGRDQKRAISQMINFINVNKLYYVVDIDIKGFFDNVDHGKLLKQLWAMGIRDKCLLSILSKMLKAEVLGVGKMAKGTSQGGILSPLLANIYLNELDWWLESKKNKGIKFVRFADDFKIFCPNYAVAKDMLIKVTKWLNNRLKLEVSKEKTKIVNLKRNNSEFLGYRFKLKKKGNGYKIVSNMKEKAIENFNNEAKKQVRKIKKYKNNDKKLFVEIDKFNSLVRGIHNYFNYATKIKYNISRTSRVISRYIYVNFKEVLTYIEEKPKWDIINVKHGEDYKIKIPCIRGKPLEVIGNISYNFKQYRGNRNFYDPNSRKLFHKKLQIENEFMIGIILKYPYMDETVEFNDNVIPKFCEQLGKFRFTEKCIYDMRDFNVVRKVNNGSDKYDNIIIVNNQVAKLLKIKGDDIIENDRYKKGIKMEQLVKINLIRKENNQSLI